MAWKVNEELVLDPTASALNLQNSQNFALAQQEATQAAQPKKKKKNFWLDQLSTVTGTLGGIGGGIVGAAAGGVGAVPGAALGGGAGAGLGEAIENLIMGEDPLTKSVAGEAALGAVFSGGPIKLGKLGIQSTAKALGKGVAKETGEAVAEGALKRTSRGLLGDAWGLRSGVKVGGKVVTPQRAGELQKFVIEQVGVPKTANADMVFSTLTSFQDEAGKAISSAVKTSAQPIKTAPLATSLQGKFSKVIGANAKDNPIATDILAQIKSAKTPEQLWQVRRNIDDSLISFGRNPASAIPGAEQFARSARSEINKTLEKTIPGIKGLNRTYSNAFDAAELVSQAARTPKGAKLPGVLGGVAGGTTQRVKSGLGRAVGGIGNIPTRIMTPPTTGPLGIGVRNVGQNLLRTPSSQQEMTPEQSLEEAMMAQQEGGAQDPFAQGGQETGGSPYTKENLMADIQSDPKNASKYISYYKSLDDIFGTKEQKGLTGESQKRALTAESGLRSLDTLAQTLNTDPGAFARQALPNPFGITARLTGTTDVRAATDNVVDVIARLRSGAAITDSEAARFARLLPQPGDSQESARRKLQMVSQELQSFASNPGGGSLEDALMQYQSQGQGF